MVPTLQVPKDALRTNGFINGYIKDSNQEIQHKESIYLLFKPTDIDKFREFLDNEYERTKSIIEDYDYSNGFVVVVYQLDEILKKDFELIKQGKYSKTSSIFKTKFPKTILINRGGFSKNEVSLQYKIFEKDEELKVYWEERLGINFETVVGKEFELWDGWEEKNEILEINKIQEYEQ